MTSNAMMRISRGVSGGRLLNFTRQIYHESGEWRLERIRALEIAIVNQHISAHGFLKLMSNKLFEPPGTQKTQRDLFKLRDLGCLHDFCQEKWGHPAFRFCQDASRQNLFARRLNLFGKRFNQ
jgi:hypothetical protein